MTSKFYNDVFFGNSYLAYIGGIHPLEMNLLELEFLKLLEWLLWVDPSEYDFYLKGIIQHFAAIEPKQHTHTQ